MPVLIADLWIPDIWIAHMAERQNTFPSVFTSGILTRTPELDAIASGAGLSSNIPFFKDITDQADEVQVENQGPATDNGQPSGKMVATILNRVTKNSVTALSGAISGADPLGSIISQLTERRMKQRNTTLIGLLRGLFGSAGAKNGAAALTANRWGGTNAEIFIEDGNASVAANNWITPDVFIFTKALLGELADDLANGVFLCHPNVKARLESLDALNFKTGVPSALGPINTYRGIPIVTSSKLVRAGGVSGFVYDSYLITRGTVGYGEKPQQGDTIDVSSLHYWKDPDKNNEFIYDRTRFVMHVNGTKWVGNPAGQTAANSELQTPGNWQLAWQTADRIGAVCFRTNG
ncbi:MAG: hypothetical protein QOD03_1275 [Verrucomicrobiota bacterium]|jgi:hypothetical protein